MGVRTTLSGITLTAGDVTQGSTTSTSSYLSDIHGMLQISILSLTELIMKLQTIQTLMTAAGDTANADTLATQITNLS